MSKVKEFVSFWQQRGDEKSDTQQFWMSLLADVFGVEQPQKFIEFEKRVQLLHVSFIDGYIESTKVLIEQKSADIDLSKAYKQSDGQELTPFQQAKRYANEMPYSLRPRWVVVCNFRSFLVYDMEKPNDDPFEILLQNLEKESYRLSFLTDTGNVHLKKEMEVSIKAGELVGKIYDAFLAQYHDTTNADTLRSLNVLCVRIVFCLYAEDAGVFGVRNMFHDYLVRFDARDFRRALIDLFRVLDTKREERDPYLDDDLAAFPYVNGGLFTDSDIEIPQFTDELRTLILDKASDDFDWSEISPTIFGAVFESTLNPDTRRSGGMHYTSIENIHKVIDPLFLDSLRQELADIKAEKMAKQQNRRAAEFQNKLAGLTFLDPACGSGNFLTETYLSLRRLENEAIRLQTKGQAVLGFEETNPVKVSIHQFYGIEINDFAVATATTALWIAESQMLKETESIVNLDLDMLPLKTYRNIVEGNALRLDWTTVVPRTQLNYIMGNPPFVGARLMNESQKQDMLDVFGAKWKNIGNMDYVSAWYYKASTLIQGTSIKTALVSTNSITQGEQVANLWKPLFEDYGIHIDFAYRTFRWDSEASLKAHVHCVIVGFSCGNEKKDKTIFSESGTPIKALSINPYLIDAPSVWIESRNKPLCDVPEIGIGNKPIDGGNYLFTEEEMLEFIKKEPRSEQYFRKWIGADEFINRWFRYCLWLGDCTPNEIRSMPECLKRVQAVRDFRLASKSEGTRKIADKPTRFHVENMPDGNYIVIPETSSERRRYTPIGFLTPDILCSNAIRLAPNATLYHFGILTSNVHMAWMRAVCGRLEMRYRYSKDIVYNNFPWPMPSEEQKAKIEQTAQAILDARAKCPESSLADLYDEVTMPSELRRAHQDNDRAVMAAYGFSTKMTESDIVAQLFGLYQQLVAVSSEEL